MKQQQKKIAVFLLAAVGLLVLPVCAASLRQRLGAHCRHGSAVRAAVAGLNIVVGYAGLLDLGYVAFFAIGAYMFGLLASPQLTDAFAAIAAMFPNGLHTPLWLVIPLAAGLAGVFGMLLGRLRCACAATTWPL